MIKINLLDGEKKANNFSKYNKQYNIGPILLAGFLYILGGYFLDQHESSLLSSIDQRMTLIKRKQQKIKSKISKNREILDQIESLKTKESLLKQKLAKVKQLLNKKKSPVKLLLFIAKNIPKDVWIEELNLVGKKMEIKGKAKRYDSIVTFVDNLKTSIFFDEQIGIPSQVTEVEKDTEIRTEKFELDLSVKTFE